MSNMDVETLIETVGVAKASAACKVAGVLFTYRCTIACKHCCFGCGTARPDVVMSPRQCVDALEMLHETGRVVHVAGGEPMLYWDALAESVRLAHARGVAPHFIETNCSFAATDRVVRDRFAFLADHGVRGIYASADAYHQQFVPPERFLRVRQLAKDIFGEQNYYGPAIPDDQVRALAGVADDARRLRDYVRGRPPIMVGTARVELAGYLEAYRPDDPELPARGWGGVANNRTCLDQFRADTMWELHIDPYGNIQTNCGMILANVSDTSPAELLAKGPERANRFVEIVCEAGGLGLARLAQREHGFKMPDRVSQTCELCCLARQFLRAHYPDVFGPEEVYA